MKRISKEKLNQARTISFRTLIAVLGVGFGILITAQMRTLPTRVTNPIAPYASLKETKEALYEEQSQLKANISELQKSLEQTQKDSLDTTLTKSELESLQLKKAQAGLTSLNGPGIIVKLDDSKAGPVSEDSIIHAADIRDIINLMWGSGAEAISINNERVVANTAIDCIVNTILVNNTRLSTPFQIEAIGDPKLLSDKLGNQNILSGLYQRKYQQGIVFTVERNNDITVPIYDGSFETGVKK